MTDLKEEQLLKSLALTLALKPTINTLELSAQVGVSRATLHRLFGNKECLIDLLSQKASLALAEIIEYAQGTKGDYSGHLQGLINIHLKNKEFLVFTCGANSSLDNAYWSKYLNAIDSYFLSGQKAREFRVDIMSTMMSELFISAIAGMIDANHRGRIAEADIAKNLSQFFLRGINET